MGPLRGFRIIEIGAIGPGPFCAMMLADMGADVIRLDRLEPVELGLKRETRFATLNRNRKSVTVNLKSPAAVELVLRLVKSADGLIEGFRPGVMERLGLGPDACLQANPRLVYGRITGWGQTGPLAQEAGHDINYLAIAGVLHGIGRKGAPPSPPLNLLADMAGGGMYLAYGMVCAMLEAGRSGQGQVVDAAMVDGAASLMTSVAGMRGAGLQTDARGENFYDGGAPWYDSYETKDGKLISIAPIEKRFYQTMIALLGLDEKTLPGQYDRAGWPRLREILANVFKTRTRNDWETFFRGHDVCIAPVLTPDEAAEHPHLSERKTYIEVAGVKQPAPAPRFSRTVPDHPTPPPEPGQHTEEALLAWGISAGEIASLRKAAAVG